MMSKASEMILTSEGIAPLSLIALEGANEMGAAIDKHLVKWSRSSAGGTDTFLVKSECPRFASGDGKGILKNTVRGNDVFIIADVGNYSCTYEMFGETNKMSPDDHYQDLKRIIQAASGKSRRINVVMPILYGGRQHKRNYRESLDCAVALQELESMGVENIITFDAHDSRVCNAVPLMGFDNVIPSYQVLKALLNNVENLKVDKDNFMVVSPDEGAIHRNMYYASVLGIELGLFYKRRDYSTIIKGRNPIVAHEYLGNCVKGKDIFIADDIISSGESMLEVAQELKKRGAERIFAYGTYSIFTSGLESFDRAYSEGVIDYVFGTNLTYRTPELLSREWFYEVDVYKYIAYLIAALNHGISTGKVINPHLKVKSLFEKHNVKSPVTV
jgi:ribose-phosphate pyrophosphokinase